MDQNYINILEESLEKKNKVLGDMLSLSEQQAAIISDDMDLSELDPFIEKKGELIEALEKLDEGYLLQYTAIPTGFTDWVKKYC